MAADATSRRRHGGLGKVLGTLALILLLAGTSAAIAATDPGASDWYETDQGKVRLIAASSAVGEGAAAQFGLEFRLEPGWKIYWRSPGDAGLPPTIDWAGSARCAAIGSTTASS